MNGLLVGLSKLRNMKAIFISGETSGYIVDASAARAVLLVLSKKLSIPIDLTEFDLKAKDMDNRMKSMDAVKEREDKDKRGYIG